LVEKNKEKIEVKTSSGILLIYIPFYLSLFLFLRPFLDALHRILFALMHTDQARRRRLRLIQTQHRLCGFYGLHDDVILRILKVQRITGCELTFQTVLTLADIVSSRSFVKRLNTNLTVLHFSQLNNAVTDQSAIAHLRVQIRTETEWQRVTHIRARARRNRVHILHSTYSL
jgi:hypothetical protein